MANNRTGSMQGLRRCAMIAAVFLMLFAMQGRAFAEPAAAGKSQLMPLAGGALVEAGQRNWEKAAEEFEQYEALWKAIDAGSAEGADAVNAAIAETKQALADAKANPEQAYQAFSKLTKATDAFVSDKSAAASQGDGKQLTKELLPILERTLAAVDKNDWPTANREYKQFQDKWKKIESAVTKDNITAYRGMEINITLARVSLSVEPPKAEAANKAVNDLLTALSDYSNGKAAEESAADGADTKTVADLIGILENVRTDLEAQQADSAATTMQSFIQFWPSAEGEVKTRSASDYNDIENKMTQVSSDLLSNPPKMREAMSTVDSMLAQLEPYKNQAGYTAWDAGMVLLREGLEALLVIAAFLAFVQRTGNGVKQKWVWSGAGTGLVLSGLLAVILTYMIANVAASSAREFIEGITGLISVLFMITVGVWLHSKASTRAWNQYVQKQVGVALASGKLWYLFALSCLTILREGAETTIFFIGMAPKIETLQLVLGISVALLIIVVLGVIIVKGSVRLPIGPFFSVATVFVYYLVIKFLGQSIHSLQIAGKLPAHAQDYLPSISWLGVYPTWETCAPQLAVLVVILAQTVRVRRNNRNDSGTLKSTTA